MKKLENVQMEKVNGGDGAGYAAVACGAFVGLGVTLLVGATMGAGIVVAGSLIAGIASGSITSCGLFGASFVYIK